MDIIYWPPIGAAVLDARLIVVLFSMQTALPNSMVTSLAKCEMDPLSDTSMQGEVLNAVRRMQNGSYKEVSALNYW